MRTNQISARMLLVVSFCLAVMSCDDKNETPAGPKPDQAALKEFFESGVTERIQQFTVSSTTGGNIKGTQGTRIEFGANAFKTLSGGAVTGNVDVELIEIYDRATMLLTKKPTNGKMENGDISTLVSGGEFYVNATQDGAQLKPAAGFTIIAPTKNTGEIDQDMRQFTGVENCVGDDCNLVWEENEDRGIEIGEFQDTGGFQTGYYVFQSQFGWTNIDRWYNDPRPKTTIFVDVPEGFDNTNCAVFIVYDGEPTALGRFDKYDASTGMFTEHYGLIPIGLEVHFILVSIIENEIHYAIQAATITANHVEVIGAVQSITEEELIDLIGELP